ATNPAAGGHSHVFSLAAGRRSTARVSNLPYRRLPVVGGVWTFMSPKRGSVPKPSVVPRLRDCVGLACQHDGNPTELRLLSRTCRSSWVIWFCHMRSNEAMRHNPVGVGFSFIPSTQGRRCAPVCV